MSLIQVKPFITYIEDMKCIISRKIYIRIVIILYILSFIDPASLPKWGIRICKHFTISKECIHTTISQFPFHNYIHVCLTYTKLTPPKAGHVTSDMELFINGESVKKGNNSN